MSMINPRMSDMFACQKCTMQLQVMKSCDCDSACAEFKCCGEPMKNITVPAVRSSKEQTGGEGAKPLSQHDTVVLTNPTMAEQAEQAKKI